MSRSNRSKASQAVANGQSPIAPDIAAITAAVMAAMAAQAGTPAGQAGLNVTNGGNVIVPVDADGDLAAAGDNVLSANQTAEGWRFPATFIDDKGKLKSYACNPVDRQAFMTGTKGVTFGLSLSLTRYDASGKAHTTEFPATCNLSNKQFQSGNHGLYAPIDSVTVTLPNGDEFVLKGQVNLQLKQRNRMRKG